MAFPPLRYSDHIVSKFSLTILKTQKRRQLLIPLLMSIFVLTGTVLRRYHLSDVPREGIFKPGSSVDVTKFCEWSQISINRYIPHHNYQIKLHSSAWYSTVFTDVKVHINHFFCFHKQNKSFPSKVKFRQASNCYKRRLEAAKFAYLNKTKTPITSQKLSLRDFCKLLLLLKIANNYTSFI